MNIYQNLINNAGPSDASGNRRNQPENLGWSLTLLLAETIFYPSSLNSHILPLSTVSVYERVSLAEKETSVINSEIIAFLACLQIP